MAMAAISSWQADAGRAVTPRRPRPRAASPSSGRRISPVLRRVPMIRATDYNLRPSVIPLPDCHDRGGIPSRTAT